MNLFNLLLVIFQMISIAKSNKISVELSCTNKTINLWVQWICVCEISGFDFTFCFSFCCEKNELISNGSKNSIVEISSIGGDFTKRAGEMALKLLIIDSDIYQLPNKISHFFPNLQLFSVVNSNVKIVNRENFDGMDAVKALDLRRNKISTIPDDIFLDLISLRKIDFSGNLISILPSNAFNSVIHLSKFMANENLIELFDSDIFRHNHKLDEIHLWGNRIKAIRFDAKKFLKLSVFDLRKNICIDEIFYMSFQTPVYPYLQIEINQKCSSYVKLQGVLIFKRSRTFYWPKIWISIEL